MWNTGLCRTFLIEILKSQNSANSGISIRPPTCQGPGRSSFMMGHSLMIMSTPAIHLQLTGSLCFLVAMVAES